MSKILTLGVASIEKTLLIGGHGWPGRTTDFSAEARTSAGICSAESSSNKKSRLQCGIRARNYNAFDVHIVRLMCVS